MPAAMSARVMTPVPPPSSMTEPAASFGTRQAMARASSTLLGTMAPILSGFLTHTLSQVPRWLG
jgi:hypothetical protein